MVFHPELTHVMYSILRRCRSGDIDSYTHRSSVGGRNSADAHPKSIGVRIDVAGYCDRGAILHVECKQPKPAKELLIARP